MPEVFMPRLSDTMQEGTVSVWNKAVGDRVDKGDILAEIETDKATMELEAYDAGVLEQILVQPGGTVPIGEIIAIIGDGSGTSAPKPAAKTAAKAASANPTTDEAEPEPEPGAESESEADTTGAGTPAEAADTSADAGADDTAAVPATTPSNATPTTPTAGAAGAAGAMKASPLARAMARDAGLDLATVKGSGPGGRIVRADVNDAVAALTNSTRSGIPASARPAATPVEAGADDVEIPLNNIRKVIARRLVESKQTVPHFYLTRVIDAQELVEARAKINAGLVALAKASDATPLKISVNDFVVKAVAMALRAHPEVNSSFAGDKLIRHGHVHVGIAVSLDDGLIVPVIRDTDTLTVSQISSQTRDLSDRARAGKLTLEEFTGGTFSISNLGMFGVDEFSAVINPPEAAILAIGTAKEEAVVRDGEIVIRNTMRITLSVDHRAVDGATGARFLATLAALLENPLTSLA